MDPPRSPAGPPSPSSPLPSLQRQASLTLQAGAQAVATMGEAMDLMFLEPRTEGQQAVAAAAAPVDQRLQPKPGSTDMPAPMWVKRVNSYLAQHALSAQQRVLRDKLTWMLGLLNAMLAARLLSYPPSFLRYFELLSVGLLGSRWFVYRLKNWHYFMAEFCYVAISVGIIHTRLFPWSPALYKLTFALFAGVLTPAVIATRNAFVLHSVDKITSLFQHLIPALVAWLLRWRASDAIPDHARLVAERPEQLVQMQSAGFVSLTLAPMAVWALWAATYYVGVFVIADAKVRERGYATMFALQTKNPKSPITKFIFSFKTRRAQYAAYLGIHGTSVLVGCLLNNLWWNSYLLHSLAVMLVLMSSMWSGACYQFDVFPQKYQVYALVASFRLCRTVCLYRMSKGPGSIRLLPKLSLAPFINIFKAPLTSNNTTSNGSD